MLNDIVALAVVSITSVGTSIGTMFLYRLFVAGVESACKRRTYGRE